MKSLATVTVGAKQTAETIPDFVNRLEQKKKIHDMSAHILMTIEKLE